MCNVIFSDERIIQQLKPKRGGIDGIHAKIIQILKEFILYSLVHVINISIGMAVWPDALKSAEIKSIFKEGDKLNPGNYRSISFILNIAKIFEKIMYTRLFSFIEKNKIISKNQFGFLKKRGTKDALGKLTRLLLEKINDKTPIAVAFLDLSKAFDTVDHVILLKKLERSVIREHASKLIASYLQNRQQKVIIQGQPSDPQTVRTGVPQGTILGPLLLLPYINDLLLLLPKNIYSYADDTAVIAIGIWWVQIQLHMNYALSKVSEWLAANKLSLKVKKQFT